MIIPLVKACVDGRRLDDDINVPRPCRHIENDLSTRFLESASRCREAEVADFGGRLGVSRIDRV